MKKWHFALALTLTACQQPVLSPLDQFPNQSMGQNQTTVATGQVSKATTMTSSNSDLSGKNPAIIQAKGQSSPQTNTRQTSQVSGARTSQAVAPNNLTSNQTSSMISQSQISNTGSNSILTSKNGSFQVPISSLNVPQGFDYTSTQDVTVDVSVSNPNGEPYRKVMVAIYAPDGDSLTPLIRGVTDNQGHYLDLMRVAGYHKSLNIQVSALGINNSKVISIQNATLKAQFGKD